MEINFRHTEKEINEINEHNKIINNLNTKINNKINDSIYVALAAINSKNMFLYIIITLVTLLFFNYLNIKFKSVIGILMGIFISYIVYNKKDLDLSTFKDQLKIKLELIRPKPKHFGPYPELIEFFYSIRDFEKYNQDVFTRCINTVDQLLLIYEGIKIGIVDCKLNVDIIKDKKRAALNHLHSLIFNTENNRLVEKKLKKALIELHKILNNYEKDMVNICNQQIKDYGYSVNKSYIHPIGPKAYNIYDNNIDVHFALY